MFRILSLCSLLLSPTALAQGWQWVSPKPQGVAVNAVTFVGQTGWLVGATGTIAQTTDGAATFSPQNSGVSADLYGVFFLDLQTGWAVGDLGTLLTTTNGGATWVRQTSGTVRLLRAVWFTDALNGFAVGDYRTLLETADGGHTWTARATSALSLNGVVFTDSLHGFFCGDGGVVLLTVDGGSTFTTIQTPSSSHLLAIAFADSLHGWAVGEGGALVTTSDGGQSWTAQTVGTADLVAVLAQGSTQALALGSDGTLYQTLDGTTWQTLTTAASSSPFAALALEPDAGALDATSQNGQWLRAPAGASPPKFTDINDLFPRDADLTAVAFGSVDAGVFLERGYIYATLDRGRHIAQVSPPADGGVAFGWRGISMPSATDVYAVGIRGTIAVSRDVGQTWTLVDAGLEDDLQAIQMFPDSGIGVAVGDQGAVLVTQNGGASWLSYSGATTVALTALAFLDPEHGACGGEDGVLLDTANGSVFGVTAGGFAGEVTGMAYPATGVVIAAASDGTLVHSTNQGVNYYELAAPGVTAGFGGMAFASRQDGWLLGNGPTGSIFATVDGAQSFASQFSGGPSLAGISLIDPTHAYVVGGGGTVLFTQTAGGPACVSDHDCADAGYAGTNCLGGSCVSCTTDDRCGPSCTPCGGDTPYCYSGYCGACGSDLQCDGGYCVLGQCQIPSSSSISTSSGGSGAGNGGSVSSSGGAGVAASSGGSSGTTTCASAYCQTSSCGCGEARGTGLWLASALAVLGIIRRRPRGS